MVGFVLLAHLALGAGNAQPATDSAVSVTVTGLRNDDGQLLLTLFDGPGGFPTKPAKAMRRRATKIHQGRASLRLHVAPGTYAVSVVHDENGNGQVDTTFIGIPKEGVGASNNAKGRMGPPKFESAKFEVTADGASQRIKILYMR